MPAATVLVRQFLLDFTLVQLLLFTARKHDRKKNIKIQGTSSSKYIAHLSRNNHE